MIIFCSNLLKFWIFLLIFTSVSVDWFRGILYIAGYAPNLLTQECTYWLHLPQFWGSCTIYSVHGVCRVVIWMHSWNCTTFCISCHALWHRVSFLYSIFHYIYVASSYQWQGRDRKLHIQQHPTIYLRMNILRNNWFDWFREQD